MFTKIERLLTLINNLLCHYDSLIEVFRDDGNETSNPQKSPHWLADSARHNLVFTGFSSASSVRHYDHLATVVIPTVWFIEGIISKTRQ